VLKPTTPIVLALACTAAVAQDAPSAPPGLVHVEGSRNAKIGTPLKVIEEMIETDRRTDGTRHHLVGETPMHTVRIADFGLMVSEVTNEQYLEFVKATGHRPPQHWGAETIDVAQAAFLTEEAARIKAAVAANPNERPIRETFHRANWWDDNWEGTDWAVAEGTASQPVLYVDYSDLLAYCRWAGLRPMTEFEFQHAAREGTDRVYPWGEEFETGKCASLEAGRDEVFPVGSFDCVTSGCYDLVGSVWEWTSSPYVGYPGYKPLKVKVGKGSRERTIEALAGFDANLRVITGGAVKLSSMGVRVATRFGAERTQRTDALGFRCASTPKLGFDTAARVVRDDVKKEFLPSDLNLMPGEVISIQRWHSREGTSGAEKIPGYAVITDFEYSIFVPVEKLNASSLKQVRDLTKGNELVHLGVIASTVPFTEPELAPGNYTLTWRGAGKLEEKKKRQEPKGEQKATQTQQADDDGAEAESLDLMSIPGFDPTVDCFVLFDAGTGAAIKAWPAPPVLFERMRPGRTEVRPWEEPKRKPKKDEPPLVPMDTLRFNAAVAGRSKTKGLVFPLELKVAPGTYDDTWLKSAGR
jgi:formylglycine-generating enzyme required for sulfatase activity